MATEDTPFNGLTSEERAMATIQLLEDARYVQPNTEEIAGVEEILGRAPQLQQIALRRARANAEKSTS